MRILSFVKLGNDKVYVVWVLWFKWCEFKKKFDVIDGKFECVLYK